MTAPPTGTAPTMPATPAAAASTAARTQVRVGEMVDVMVEYEIPQFKPVYPTEKSESSFNLGSIPAWAWLIAAVILIVSILFLVTTRDGPTKTGSAPVTPAPVVVTTSTALPCSGYSDLAVTKPGEPPVLLATPSPLCPGTVHGDNRIVYTTIVYDENRKETGRVTTGIAHGENIKAPPYFVSVEADSASSVSFRVYWGNQ